MAADGMIVLRSGFDASDSPWQFVAMVGQFYAYGETAEQAAADLDALLAGED